MMSNSKCVLLLFSLLLVVVITALPGDPECLSPCAAGLTTCSMITYDIFMPSNASTVIEREGTVARLMGELGAANRTLTTLGRMNPTCFNTINMILCNMLHPGCNTEDNTTITACVDRCQALHKACPNVTQYLPNSLTKYFNCNGTYEDGSPYYTAEAKCSSVNTTRKQNCVAQGYNNTAPVIAGYYGSCQKFNKTSAPDSFELCAPFTSENIFVSTNWPTVQSITEQAAAALVYQVDQYYPVIPRNCYTELMGLLCRAVFPPCHEFRSDKFNRNFGYGISPCYDLCSRAVSKCADFFVAINISFVTACTNIPKGEIVPRIPEGVANQAFNLTCSGDTFPMDAAMGFAWPDAVCPPETGRKTHLKEDSSYCEMRCPDASYDHTEWEALSEIVIVGATFSLITMTFLTLSYTLQKDRRRFPSSIHFWEFVATAMFAISFLIGGRNPAKSTWCFDEGTNATQGNNARCAVQGFFFIYFGMALTAWCCVIAFMMFYAIVFDRKISNLRKYTPHFHIFGWGVPMVFAVAAAASNSIGYGPPLAWCFIHFEGFGFVSGSGISKDYIFFYIPEAVLFFSIMFMFIATVGKIIYVRKNKIAKSSVARAGSRTFKAQIRVLVFIFVVFVICFTIFEWRLQIQQNKEEGRVGIDWTICRIKAFLSRNPDPACLNKTNPARINYDHTAFESFVLSGIGILIFVGFGADPNIYRHWVKLFKLAYAREWEKMRDLVVLGKDPFKDSKKDTSGSGQGTNSRNSKGSFYSTSTFATTGVSRTDSKSRGVSGVEKDAAKSKREDDSPSVEMENVKVSRTSRRELSDSESESESVDTGTSTEPPMPKPNDLYLL